MDDINAAPVLWHHLAAEDALAQVNSRAEGLTMEEVVARQAKYGANRLPPARKTPPLLRFLAQFRNVLIYVLIAAALVTALLGHWTDTSVILGVVLINALIGFIQEGKAEKALEAIRGLLSQHAVVLREGARDTVPAEDLVPGDIVLLRSGDRVPADLRLLKVRSLQIEEAALTGESMPVEKNNAPARRDAGIGDRHCMAFSSTMVTHGQATGVVVASGSATEIGRINELLANVEVLTTPLLRQMDRFGGVLSIGIVGLALFTFLFGTLLRDYTSSEMFLAAVGLAVAAIPEGLPAIVTITLAIGVQRMARRNAIIRRLPAVETLGSVSVICSDKTGTLTRNEMTVQAVETNENSIQVQGIGYDPHGAFLEGDREIAVENEPILLELCRAALLCNDAELKEQQGRWEIQGNPTEAALITLALKAGIDPALVRKEFPRTDVIPFESEHRFMATLHHDHAGHGFIMLKGAPEQVLEMCTHQRKDGEDQPIDPGFWLERMEHLAERGYRLIAIAFKSAFEPMQTLNFADVKEGLTLLGITGLLDPPRDEAIEAVQLCHSAGVRVKMITGDHVVTARAVAAQMGIGHGGEALTGQQVEALSDAELQQAVLKTEVFARASPEHKLRLVQALQAQEQVVAMTGDGVNDAPALRRADVGVAMGINGTEVAKEASEMVLADDNFASITRAVEEGRTVYNNIKKSVLFILPTNGGEALIIVGAILLGQTLPITPLQILWVNMITAVTLALSLAFEPGEPSSMRQPPRPPHEPLLTPFLIWRIVFVSLIMVAGTFGLYLWERHHGMPLEEARTMAVNTLVLFEVFYLFNTRRITDSVVSLDGLFGNRHVLAAIVIVLLFQLLFTYTPPFQQLFDTRALDAQTWLTMTLVAATVFLLVEVEKAIVRPLQKRRHRRLD